jgi:hypothetical protein
MTVFAVYIDLPTFLNQSAVNQETNSLVGMNTTLVGGSGGTYPAGSTTLAVGSTTGITNASPSANNPATTWILDGLNSEIVSVTAISGTTLTLTAGTLAAHTNGTSISTAGTAGCLADMIHQASREVDNICCQGPEGVTEYDGTPLSTDRSLYAISRVETYEAPYGYAQFNVDNALTIYPYHFPARSVTSITVQVGAMTPVSMGTQYLTFSQGGRVVTVPYAQLTSTPPNIQSYFVYPFSRNQETFLVMTYTGGPIASASLSAVPGDIQRATMLLVADTMATRKNPYGAATARLGDEQHMFELRGDTAGKSLLWKDAAHRLQPYTRKV